MNIIKKRLGEEFRDKVAANIEEFLTESYPVAKVSLTYNTSGSPLVRIDNGDGAVAHIIITRARQ